MKLVTVYIVTHNRSQMLVRAIESVFAQTYTNIELIVVDDASSDDTKVVVEALQSKYPILYIRNQESRGACYSRNLALNSAKGELITGMDDDDYFGVNRVEDLVLAYQESYSLVCANIVEVTQDGEFERQFGFSEGLFNLDKLLYQNLVGNQMLTSVAKLKAIGGFDEQQPAFQDYDTWVRLVEKFGPGRKINKHNYFLQTEHGGERISTSNARKVRGFELFLAKHKNKMSPSHLKSMEIMRHKVSGRKLSITNFIKLVTPDNYKSALSLMLKQYGLRR